MVYFFFFFFKQTLHGRNWRINMQSTVLHEQIFVTCKPQHKQLSMFYTAGVLPSLCISLSLYAPSLPPFLSVLPFNFPFYNTKSNFLHCDPTPFRSLKYNCVFRFRDLNRSEGKIWLLGIPF